MSHDDMISQQQLSDSKTQLGLWAYLMTDIILFAALFATYAVLRNNTFGGPTGRELFDLPYVLVETLLLLTSSFTVGLATIALHNKRQTLMLSLLVATFILGAMFLTMELSEFSSLVSQGNSWQRSGFLSAFFTLVGTHGLHIATGLLWMGVLLVTVMRRGITSVTTRQVQLLSLFWHFLDVIWIFIFTIVYLMGVA
jgi:cytochrome o ubiquinol oxidase subunit 3